MSAYPIYQRRGNEILNGIWDFCWLGDRFPLEEVAPSQAVYHTVMAVPGAFDAGPEYAGQRGVGLYRRKVLMDDSAATLRLRLGGLGLRARIFWDGREIGATELAYSGVWFDFETGAGVAHELVIAVDNRIPKTPVILFNPNYDFYGYGGLYRGVELQRLPECRLERVQVSALDLKEKKVRLRISLSGKVPTELAFKLAFDDGQTVDYSRKPLNGVIELEQIVPNGRIWSPETPALHTLTVSIKDDCVIERFGMRTIEAKRGKILLNGKPVLLRGLNRHEAHPEMGPALPVSLMIEDLQFLKDLGCNFIRGAHYPQDQQFLDLCDQLGFLVWEESLGWGDKGERIVDQHFGDLQEAQTRLMVRNSFNHPSVIVWAFLNEGSSDRESSRAIYSRLLKAVREEDDSRLVSYASNRTVSDLFLQHVDLISMNIYPAWIDAPDWRSSRPFERIAASVAKLAEFCDRPELKDKPFILSEIGTCGLYGWRDRLKAGWSEEYQADYCEEAIRSVFSNHRLSGITIWQLYDNRTFSNGEVRSKARTFNNAGILDEYRRPKLAYDVVKRAFHAQRDGH